MPAQAMSSRGERETSVATSSSGGKSSSPSGGKADSDIEEFRPPDFTNFTVCHIYINISQDLD